MSVNPMMTQQDIEALWLTSYRDYARDQLLIQPMLDPNSPTIGGTKLEPLLFNEPQEILDGIINKIKAEGRLVRLNILKARREGVSTYISGRNYWMTTTRFNRYALMITHEPEATEFLFQMIKRYYIQNPIWKPQITYNNKKLLNFDTPDGKGLGSAIRVATAGKEDIGSGQAVHYLHLSEMAKWPSHTADALMTSVMQCVPKSPDTEVVIESTAKGVGGEFYMRYWGAKYFADVMMKDGKPYVHYRVNPSELVQNEFTSIFLPWFIFGKYQMDPGPDFQRTKEEDELIITYGLTDRQIAWRRWCIHNNCNGSEEIFRQEYPSNAEEAFIASGTPVWSMQQLVKLIENAPEPIMRYTINVSDGSFIASPTVGEFKVWEEPITNEEYIVAADVGEGINRNVSGRIADFSAAGVFKCSSGEQVAEWHGKIDPDLYGMVLAYIGRRYNIAHVVPERNGPGNSTVLKLVDIRYPKIYVERVPEPPNKIRKRFGWLTGRTNKGDTVHNLQAEMRDGTHGLKSKELFREMMSFKQEGQEYGADVGKFDDRVMYALIGKFVLPMLKSRKYRKDNREMDWSGRSETPSAIAWMA